ncbi:MAG TPA: ATP-binding protein [Vicinamibacterales bacterium]|nr:ATP-binding protein [Vicinamibacterales bacterium]
MTIDVTQMTGGATVLAVYEPGANLSRLSAALQEEGYDVLVAASERDVSDLLASRTVDCVVLPFESTSHAARQQAAASGIPLVVTVAAGDEAFVVRALEAGADDCIQLSADLGLFKARLRALVRRKRRNDDRRAALAAAAARKDAELVSLNYAIAHDLRAPLRAIDGFGRILLEECAGTLDEKHANYLRRIGGAATELGVLIDDLLQLSRVGRAELRKGRVDLTEVARRVAADLQAGSSRQVEVDVEAELSVYADRTLMRLALEHLIGNSWKFTAPSAAARIECRAEHASGHTAIVVRDNGVGFDQARADKLFQPFQRLHTSAEFEGAGIGLAVVQKIVDRHGGRVWAEGRAGQGASFYITLPPAPDGDGDPR